MQDYYFGHPESLGSKVLLIKRDHRLEAYKPHFSNISEFGHVWRGFTGRLGGQAVSVISTGIGPSLVGDAVYALDRTDALYLYSGTCGGLHADVGIGDYVIAEEAVCADGFSFLLGHAPLATVRGDGALVTALRAQLLARSSHVHAGAAFSTSSVVREVDADFWDLVDQRCMIVEMAAAALYAAALRTRNRAVAYYWVSDAPTAGKSFFDSPEVAELRIRQARYDRSVQLDLELIAAL